MSTENSIPQPRKNSTDKAQLAVLIDFENISISARDKYGLFSLSLLLQNIEKLGRITIKRAYGDWDRFNNYRKTLLEEAVELIQLFSVSHENGGKNRADLRVAVDAMELVFTQSYIDTIVIVSGDSDFSSLMLKVREYGKYTIGAGVRNATSRLLVNSCDDFIFYDELINAEKQRAGKCLEQVIKENIPTNEGCLRMSRVRQKMLRFYQGFNERVFGHSDFREFLEDYSKLVRIVGEHNDPFVYRADVIFEPAHVVLQQSPESKPEEIGSLAGGNGIVLEPVVEAQPHVQDAQEVEREDQRLARFLSKIGYRPLPQQLKSDLLTDLLGLASPGATLNQILKEVKTRFSQNDVAVTKEQLRTAARLVYHSGLLDFGSERPSLTAVIRQASDPKSIDVNRFADQVYLRKLAASGFTLTPELAAAIFPGEGDRKAYYTDLLADLKLQGALINNERAFHNAIPNLVESALQHEIFERVRADLEYIVLSEDLPVSRSSAEELLELSLNKEQERAFAESAQTSLKAAKIMTELIRRGEPGNSLDELSCYLAVYCRNKARTEFDLKSLKAARDYFLAFLFILQDGELAWEMKPRMLRMALIYYWAVMASPCEVSLENLESTTTEELLIKIKAEGNHYVDSGLTHLSSKLASANAALVRLTLESLKQANQDPALTAEILAILEKSLEDSSQ